MKIPTEGLSVPAGSGTDQGKRTHDRPGITSGGEGLIQPDGISPLCACGCRRRVKWNKNTRQWRKYGSRKCSGKLIGSQNRVRYQRERSKWMHINMIADVLGAHYRDGDAVTLAQVVKLMKMARARGYSAGLQSTPRHKRGVAA